MLAPMVGLSHVALRSVVREYMPRGAIAPWPTEMLNSRRLPIEKFELVPEVLRDPAETHLVPQILGNEEEPIRLSVKRLEHEWGASGIDINMGCPVKKALSHNYGVSLMGDTEYAAEVVRMTVRHTTLPVSVKLRAGPKTPMKMSVQNGGAAEAVPLKDEVAGIDFLLRFAGGLVDAGAESLTLHPRTAEQKRRGLADWDQIRILRESVRVAVIGNGDIQTADDVFRMLEQTGCDAVMVGRALTARPWLLWQVGARLGWPDPVGREGEKPPVTAFEEGREFGRVVLKLIDRFSHYHPPLEKAHWSDELLLRKTRFFLKNAAPWLQFGHELEAKASKAKTLAEARSAIAKFFEAEHSMSARTDLRY
jgi:tRNA-dihydrouridine synthase B